ncbi:MAG: hypothetical protein ACYCZ0_04330 [Minisyncoccota bacterium]
MIRTVLWWVLIGMVILLAGAWLWVGGASRIVSFVKTIANPIDIIWGTSTSTYKVELPWQLPIPQGPDIEGLANEGEAYENMSAEERLDEVQRQYDSIQKDVAKLGRSPYADKVSLSRAAATEAAASNEYLVIDASGNVSLVGWSLMSMLTGAIAPIPLAATVYEHGTLNNVRAVSLEPGTSAIVMSGFSPAGVSFRENRCTGYLAQNLSFEPSLANACPSPAESMSLTDQNLLRYGGDCVDYVQSLPQCTYPTTIPASLAPACRIYIANTFSYNGCVQTHRYESNFMLDTWRLYLGSPVELWGNTHDVIRLLDENGQTVDSITY